MKLSLLLLATAGAGAVAQNPFDDLMKCAQAGASADECTSTHISDGSCRFCTSDSLGQAVCTTSQAADAMKQFLPDLDCGDSDASLSFAAAAATAKELKKKAAKTETDELSRLIFLSAIGPAQGPVSGITTCAQNAASPDQCAATEVSDGSDCVFCTSDSVQQSICTTESASEMLKQLLPDLDCGSDDSTAPTVKDNIQDLLLCAQSGASPDQCASTEMSDGEHCVMCKSASVSQDLCTTPSASTMMKQFIPDLQCGSETSSGSSTGDHTDAAAIDDSIQDIMTCAQASTSADNCRSTSVSDGSDCLFCTSESLRTSVCTTSEASEMIKGFVQDVKCGGDANRLRGGKTDNEGILDLVMSSCILSSGLDDEKCSEAGEDCVWCPSLAGNYGVCLSHEEAAIASKKGWLKCPEVPTIAIE